MADTTGWIITTSGQRAVADVVDDVARAGFTVVDVLDEIGSITGHAPAAVAARLRAIPGVLDVSPESAVDIGPPGAPLS